jgi:short-chain Z-isoprenyl diphosphate synthase
MAYGGREEIADAFRRYVEDHMKRGEKLEDVLGKLDPESLEPHLYTSGQPEPDLILRTSGEVRLSGFLLWQSCHSEFYFTDTNWPAFREIDFLRALRSYHQRQRRYGR